MELLGVINQHIYFISGEWEGSETSVSKFGVDGVLKARNRVWCSINSKFGNRIICVRATYFQVCSSTLLRSSIRSSTTWCRVGFVEQHEMRLCPSVDQFTSKTPVTLRYIMWCRQSRLWQRMESLLSNDRTGPLIGNPIFDYLVRCLQLQLVEKLRSSEKRDIEHVDWKWSKKNGLVVIILYVSNKHLIVDCSNGFPIKSPSFTMKEHEVYTYN
jgi:hypothetical protein